MVTDGSWLTTNKKDMQIVALTSALQEVKKEFGDLVKKVSFNQDKPKFPPRRVARNLVAENARPKLAALNGRLRRKGR